MDYNKALHFSAVITDLASKSQQYFGQLLDDGEASPSGCLPFLCLFASHIHPTDEATPRTSMH